MFRFPAVYEENGHADEDQDRDCAGTSLHTEIDIIEQAVRRQGGIQPEYGVSGYDTAVW